MRVKVEPAAITQPEYPSRQQRRAFERQALAEQQTLNRQLNSQALERIHAEEKALREERALVMARLRENKRKGSLSARKAKKKGRAYLPENF